MSGLRIIQPRSCGECNACCTKIGVPELDKPRGVQCQHVSEAGCGIYATRPANCAKWKCAWLNRDSPLFKTSDRPDKLGVIVFQEYGPRGVQIVAEEIRDNAAMQLRVRVLLGEFSKERPVVLRKNSGEDMWLQ